MTLIEVVAALVVLGTLVASVAIARGRSMRQYARADLQLRATQAADAMLSSWLSGPPEAIPAQGGGAVSGLPGCTWRTRTVADPAARRLGGVIVRLEIADATRQAESDRLLVAVEFLSPRKLSDR